MNKLIFIQCAHLGGERMILRIKNALQLLTVQLGHVLIIGLMTIMVKIQCASHLTTTYHLIDNQDSVFLSFQTGKCFL